MTPTESLARALAKARHGNDAHWQDYAEVAKDARTELDAIAAKDSETGSWLRRLASDDRDKLIEALNAVVYSGKFSCSDDMLWQMVCDTLVAARKR